MYALRERRVHVTQEDLELAVAKVWNLCLFSFRLYCSYHWLETCTQTLKFFGELHLLQYYLLLNTRCINLLLESVLTLVL